MMARRPQQTDGFTLLEMLIVLFGLSCVTLLSIHLLRFPSMDDRLFTARYVHLQSEALLTSEHRTFQEVYGGGYDIEFAQNGYVQKAQTLVFSHGQTIVIELATGRLKEWLSGN